MHVNKIHIGNYISGIALPKVICLLCVSVVLFDTYFIVFQVYTGRELLET